MSGEAEQLPIPQELEGHRMSRLQRFARAAAMLCAPLLLVAGCAVLRGSDQGESLVVDGDNPSELAVPVELDPTDSTMFEPVYDPTVSVQQFSIETLPPNATPPDWATTTLATTTTTAPPPPPPTMPPTTQTPRNGCKTLNSIRVDIDARDEKGALVGLPGELGFDAVDAQGNKRDENDAIIPDPLSRYTRIYRMNWDLPPEGDSNGKTSGCIDDVPASARTTYVEYHPRDAADKSFFATAASGPVTPGPTSRVTIKSARVCQPGSNSGETGTITFDVDGGFRYSAWGNKRGFAHFDGDMAGEDRKVLTKAAGGQDYTVSIQIRGEDGAYAVGLNDEVPEHARLVPVWNCGNTVVRFLSKTTNCLVEVVLPDQTVLNRRCKKLAQPIG